MKSISAALILFMVLLSFHEGESYKWWHVCKEEIKLAEHPADPCQKPQCNELCSYLHHNTRAWGSCQDNICLCFYLCYEDVHPPRDTLASSASSVASVPDP